MKNRIVTIILTIFFGTLGVHRFYLGQIGWGIFYLMLAATGITTILSLVDFVIFIFMSDKDFDLKYN